MAYLETTGRLLFLGCLALCGIGRTAALTATACSTGVNRPQNLELRCGVNEYIALQNSTCQYDPHCYGSSIVSHESHESHESQESDCDHDSHETGQRRRCCSCRKRVFREVYQQCQGRSHCVVQPENFGRPFHIAEKRLTVWWRCITDVAQLQQAQMCENPTEITSRSGYISSLGYPTGQYNNPHGYTGNSFNCRKVIKPFGEGKGRIVVDLLDVDMGRCSGFGDRLILTGDDGTRTICGRERRTYTFTTRTLSLQLYLSWFSSHNFPTFLLKYSASPEGPSTATHNPSKPVPVPSTQPAPRPNPKPTANTVAPSSTTSKGDWNAEKGSTMGAEGHHGQQQRKQKKSLITAGIGVCAFVAAISAIALTFFACRYCRQRKRSEEGRRAPEDEPPPPYDAARRVDAVDNHIYFTLPPPIIQQQGNGKMGLCLGDAPPPYPFTYEKGDTGAV